MIRTAFQIAGHRYSTGTRQIVASLAIVGTMLSLTACATGGYPQASVVQANSGDATDYRIEGGDKLKITVFDEPTLTGDYDVGLEGALSLPLVGTVPAVGKTSDELSRTIATALSSGGYVLSPRVAVEVSAHRPFFILGEVKTPGEYPYVGNLTLEQAVAKAGGFTARAAKGTVILRRQNWATPKQIKIDAVPLEILPGDTITVKEAFF